MEKKSLTKTATLSHRDLPPGYTYKSYPYADWWNYAINLVTVGVPCTSDAQCASESFARGGFFFTYNNATKLCWPKSPLGGFPDRSTLVPTSSTTFFEIPDRDFAGMFALLPSNKRATSRLECAQICFQTPGCVVATYVHSGSIQYDCALKAPSYAGGPEFATAGVVFQPPPVSVPTMTIVLPPPIPTGPEIVTLQPERTTTNIDVGQTITTRSISVESSFPTTIQTSVSQPGPVRNNDSALNASSIESSSLNVGLILGLVAGFLFATGAIYWFYQRSRRKDTGSTTTRCAQPLPIRLCITENVIHPSSKVKEPSGNLFIAMEGAIAEAVVSTSRSAYTASILNLPRNVNEWTIDQATAWIVHSGGGIEGGNRAKAQKINGRALIVLEVATVLDVVQCPTVGDRVILHDAIMELRTHPSNELPAYR
ncbi:hypothetical protein BDR26DRAFT_853911 [Obelidium mucronatum]|nr:hypothetical protein BDR26DRAFT_853911 [Obelidium mucronatum]